MKIWEPVTLLLSTSTLLCCALPAFFVTIGAGSTFASMITNFPQLIWLSNHKNELFILSAIILLIGGFSQFKTRNSCPIEKNKLETCKISKKWSLVIYLISLILYTIGAFMAFIAPKII